MSRWWCLVKLTFVFAYEMVRASLQVALWIVKPNERLCPAFVQLPLDLKSENGLVTLAQMITLTPGTLSLEFSPDHDYLLMHVMHAPDPDLVIQDIKRTFERPLMKICGEVE
ncbi:MAG: Na+/H+ antiporter subunit E [Bdellovibrionaceae bacterium]|nr:Na+/H+ antiporter subunit E [Pseudobdellovibrionaceae bacterium]